MTIATIKRTILKEIEAIPEDHLEELYKIIQSYTVSIKKRNKTEFQKLLLKGPVWGDTELENIRQLRKEMDTWPIQNF